MIQFVNAIAGTIRKPSPVLLSPTMTIDGGHSAVTREVRGLLLKSLLEDEYYKQLLEGGRLGGVVNKLRYGIQKETA